ncbi:hypothetical protein OE88DRAFT_1645011 [Heliocybe sulcata]|uniref:Uncharacterized protein n=1 Tax=Heliocybe sulcata TaxID=5364 RepID=A0A5C3N3P8_9AGAM|nr:hypothetical protein OE88DRAFT_1645011 [Heliocybe sulcata]
MPISGPRNASNEPEERNSTLNERYLIYNKSKGCTHPLWPWGTAIVVLTEVSDKVVRQKLRQSLERKIPAGLTSATEVERNGFLQLKAGDGLFTRVVSSETDDGKSTAPEEDEIQAWVSDYDFLVRTRILAGDTLKTRLDVLTEDLLGPAHQRTSSAPTTSKDPKGGTALERLLWRISPNPGNRQGSRCYSMGYSIERPHSLVHPSRLMRYRPDISPAEDVRTRLVQTVTEYGGAAMKLAPPERIELMKNIGDINNIPPLGHRANQNYWTGLQVNVSRPTLCNSKDQLKSDLGRAGDAHPDIHDDIGSFTMMTVLTHTPIGYSPAFFFLLEFGIFIQMDYGSLIAFSGLRLHGRAPSTAPSNVTTVPGDCYSITAILYNTSDIAATMKNRLSLFPPLVEKRTAAELGVQALPPEAWQTDAIAFANDPTYQANMFTDGHILAGDRLPAYNLKLVCNLLRYANKFSPVYQYNWNEEELVADIEVKIRDTEEAIFSEHTTMMETEKTRIQEDWNRLVTSTRILLGGKSAKEGDLPKRALMTPTGKRKRLICEVVIPTLPKDYYSLNAAPPVNHASSSKSRIAASSPEQEVQAHESDKVGIDGAIRNPESDKAGIEGAIHNESSSEEEVDSDTPVASAGAGKGKMVKPLKRRRTDTNDPDIQADQQSERPEGMTERLKPGPKKKDYKSALMAIFDEAYLTSIHKELKEQLTMKPDSVQTYTVPKPFQTAALSAGLLAFTQTEVDSPQSKQSHQDVRHIWEQLTKGRMNLKKLGVTTKLIRHGIMLGVWKNWEYMEIHCRQDCEDVLWKNKTNDLSKLVKKVLQHLTTNPNPPLQLNAKDYLENFTEDSIATVPPKRTRLIDDAEHRSRCYEVVTDEVIKVLCTWLGYSRAPGKQGLWRDQGMLIDILIRLTGNSFLCFLDEVWDAFEHPKQLVKTDGDRRTDAAYRWDALETEIRETVRAKETEKTALSSQTSINANRDYKTKV